MHLTPAGLPSGIPGIGDEIEIAMQQAPQSGRQSIKKIKDKSKKTKVKSKKVKAGIIERAKVTTFSYYFCKNSFE